MNTYLARRPTYSWIVIAATLVHFSWGILLLYSSEPLMTTPMAEIFFNSNQYIASGVYLFAAISASVTLLNNHASNSWHGVIFCMPQQFLLMMSASTAIRCVMRGSYADGVPRPWEFILADQLWVIVGMAVHTIVLLDLYVFAERETKWNGLQR